jgi:hypothetical protein
VASRKQPAGGQLRLRPQRQIGHDLRPARHVDGDHHRARRQLHLHRDALAEQVLQQQLAVGDDVIEINASRRQHVLLTEGE